MTAVEWPVSVVVLVDSLSGEIETYVRELDEGLPEGAETVFIVGRDRRDAMELLVQAGQIVLSPPPRTGTADALARAMAATSGDPIVVTSTSVRPPPVFFEEAILAPMRDDGVGVVVLPDERFAGQGAGPRAGHPAGQAAGQQGADAVEATALAPGPVAIARRALDALGTLRTVRRGIRPGASMPLLEAYASLMDLQARAQAAGIPVRIAEGHAVSGPARGGGFDPESFEDMARRLAGGGVAIHVPADIIRQHLARRAVQLISFTFVTHERLDYLARTWDRLFEVTPELRRLKAEFSFVDNGSGPEVTSWLLDKDAWVLLNPSNRGIAPARNQALALTVGDPIVMIDPDILLPDGWFEKALDVLTIPGIGFSAVSEEGTTYQVVEIEGVPVEIKQGNIAGVWIIPRRTLWLLGYFSEEYQMYGGEDSDYGSRIMCARLLNTYLPNLKGHHIGADDGVYSTNRTDYVEMKAKWWDVNMSLAQTRAQEYAAGMRSLYVPKGKRLL